MASEDKKKNHSFRDFKGVNTQADRKMIGDDEFAWLENVMPIGHGNARTIPAPSAALYTLPVGAICYYMAEGNISGVSYMYLFCTNGSCYQVNLTTYAQTIVGAAGTFSGTTSRIAQWKNERICIIDATNGYFDWNGTTLTTYKGTVASVTVTAGGTGFTNATTTTLTPSSGSATFSCTLAVNLVTLSAAGTGYAVGDVLTVAGGTFTSAATISVTAVSSGAITGVNLLTTGNYTIAPSNPASVTGGHGSSATFTLNFSLGTVTVVTPGSGYVSAPTITIAGAGAGANATTTVNMGVTASGTSIASYSGRIWISSGRTILFTAPSSYNDFNPTDLAGSLIMTDDTMKGSIQRLFSANNFLYVVGQNSINVISNVVVTNPQTSSTGAIIVAATTTFSNTNITPTIGTMMPDSIVPFYRTIEFATDYGIIGLTGSTPQKISDDLDGVFPNVDFTQVPTGGLATIFNILCLCYLVKYNDPVSGQTRSLLAIHFNKMWYFSSQVAGLKFVATAYPDVDKPSLWGTDGNSLYKLFSNTTNSISQIITTKLWDMGSPLITKQVLKLGIETISSGQPAQITVSLDTDANSITYNTQSVNTMVWKNNSGGIITWTNNASQPLIWYASGYVFSKQDVGNVGNYVGMTNTTTSPNMIYTGFHLQYEPRTPWTGVPF